MEEEILNTSTFYWFKAQHRGEVAVPLHYLTDEQKISDCAGFAQSNLAKSGLHSSKPGSGRMGRKRGRLFVQ